MRALGYNRPTMSNNPSPLAALADLAARAEALLKKTPAADVEKNARQFVISQLAKEGLVTREEYEIQLRLVARAEEKLAVLEAKMAALEAAAREPR